MLINSFISFPPAGGGYTGPLDLTATPAIAAFSVSRALSTARIGQNVVRLRRDSDDAELDFVAGANGLVDTAAVATWLSGSSPFVVTSYDQSGNANNAVQADTTRQPPWVASAVNGHPSMEALNDATGTQLVTSQIVYPSGQFVGFICGRGRITRFWASLSSPDDMEFNGGVVDTSDAYLQYNNTNDAGISGDPTGLSMTDYHLWDATAKFNACDYFCDGVSTGINEFTDGSDFTGTAITIVNTRWQIGGSNQGDTSGSSEVIMWATLAPADRLAIRQNIATYYGITL